MMCDFVIRRNGGEIGHAPMFSKATKVRHLLAWVFFLREQPHQEVSFFIGIESRRHDAVDAWLETEPIGDLSSIDECVWAGRGGMVQEIVPVQTGNP